MEHSLILILLMSIWHLWCLNPYSNGTLSDHRKDGTLQVRHRSLNPYSNGTLSDTIN